MALERTHDVKIECYEHESSPSPGTQDGELLAPDVRPAAEKQLVRTLDMRLLPALILIYLINGIDRAAVASARLKGLQQDLLLTDIQYEIVLAILYVSYIPAQLPSNMILNKISRPSYYMSACVILWGVTSALTGVAHNYAGILSTRLFVGLPEAAFYPGGTYLLSRWYTRKELALRATIFTGGGLISIAFGSLIAAGILSSMEGQMGIRAWRWLFYFEGSITIVIGILTVFLLPDWPHNTRWLSPAQRRLAQVRLTEDAGEADEDNGSDSIFKGLLMAFRDPTVFIFGAVACFQLVGGGFVGFFPTIVATLGFSTTVTLLLAAPPWIIATIFSCLNAWHADRTGERYLHVTVPYWMLCLGYVIAVSTMSVPGRYISTFIMAAGSSSYPLMIVWLASAVPRPPAKRSVAIAIMNGCAGVGALSFIWKSEWGPEYRPSMFISMGTLGLGAVLATVIRCILARQNKRLEREEVDSLTSSEKERIENAARLEGLTYEDALQRRRGFRYLL
ncbi:MFS general substrate transporter [Lentinus tigrinus ALCF2SS1-7]|uniref:MFS general substrate transporter n=1 Tax=Lentinus tigrinus ALCF2SS1-6 TaxID=1328759 RepID=A0A5C2S737_9APHY|nr:MFS general substrate transporter [Lentinus tigrinus ALCF2SS1-6]RPD69862.1 MFS general substrate transporter [Lentinus tigrinus ALCF2SS1-7]